MEVRITNPDALTDLENQFECGVEFPHLTSKDFEIPFKVVPPPDGYIVPINNETREKFPLCCATHKQEYEAAKSWFDKFPDCCEFHKKVIGAHWFDKTQYITTPEKVLQQISYTEHIIKKEIENKDWYKKIIDYFKVNISSFGQLPSGFGGPVGLHLYIQNIKKRLSDEKWANKNIVDKAKRGKLLKFFDDRDERLKIKSTQSPDLNLLYATYKKWLKTFPFNVNKYFGHLQEYYTNHFPIIKNKPDINSYTGIAEFEVYTQSDLIEKLVSLTKDLIGKVNVQELVDEGLISTIDQHSLQIANEKLRIGTIRITEDFTKGELQYVKALKQWLKLHLTYFKEIANFKQPEKTKEPISKKDSFKAKLLEYDFFALKSVSSLSEPGKIRILDLLDEGGMPYCIAMFEYLGFLSYLQSEKFPSQYAMCRELSKWFNSDKEGRSIKGNIGSLVRVTTEQNKKRYTAHLHKEKVKTDYLNIK